MKRSVVFLACAAAFLAFAVSEAGSWTSDQKGVPVVKKRMRGTVLRIDEGTGTVTIDSRKATVTFYVVEETTIRRSGAPCGLDDLRGGDNVTILYKQEGKRKVAISIFVQREVTGSSAQKTRPYKE